MTQQYDASLLIEGWFPLRLTAQNRNEAHELISSGLLVLKLVRKDTHEEIGEVISDSGKPMMKIEIEDIEIHRPDELAFYYAPIDYADEDVGGCDV